MFSYLRKYQVKLREKWNKFLADNAEDSWILFAFEGKTDDLNYFDAGENWKDELIDELSTGRLMYGAIIFKHSSVPDKKVILFCWHGQTASPYLTLKRPSIDSEVKNLCAGFHYWININSEEHVSEDFVLTEINHPSCVEQRGRDSRRNQNSVSHQEINQTLNEPKSIPIKSDVQLNTRNLQAPKKENLVASKTTTHHTKPKSDYNKAGEGATNARGVISKMSKTESEPTQLSKELENLKCSSNTNNVRGAAQKISSQNEIGKGSPVQPSKTKVQASQKKEVSENSYSAKKNEQLQNKQTSKLPNVANARNAQNSSASVSNVKPSAHTKSGKPAETDTEVKDRVQPPISGSENKQKNTHSKTVQTTLPQKVPEESAGNNQKNISKNKEEIGKFEKDKSTSAENLTVGVVGETSRKLSNNVMVVGLYDFKYDLPQELSFSKNERLAIVGEPIGEWWTAKNSSGQIGSIPANYVKEVTLPPKPQKKHQHQEPPKITKKLPKTPLEQLYVGLFDFTATTSEELSFKKGDFLKLVAKSEPDWWMISNMAGQQGLVPSNYIQLKPDADDIQEPVKTKQNNAEECYQVISKCRFEARLDDELEFDEGELLTVLQKQDENWSLARNSNNKVGLIPNTYVNLVDLHGPQSSDSSTEKYVALFDFSKQYEDDLSMKAGDVLFLVNKDDEDWWLMKNTSHETGRVPSTYLKGI